jgi:hypothetical protein
MHMQKKRPIASWIAGLALLFLGLFHSGLLAAQPQQPRSTATPAPRPQTSLSDEDLSATREQLFKLLRLSPKLTSVVARDGSFWRICGVLAEGKRMNTMERTAWLNYFSNPSLLIGFPLQPIEPPEPIDKSGRSGGVGIQKFLGQCSSW